MGMFDVLSACCPECLEQIQVQSKAGPCSLSHFDLANAPPEILLDLQGKTLECSSCKSSFELNLHISAELVPSVAEELNPSNR